MFTVVGRVICRRAVLGVRTRNRRERKGTDTERKLSVSATAADTTDKGRHEASTAHTQTDAERYTHARGNIVVVVVVQLLIYDLYVYFCGAPGIHQSSTAVVVAASQLYHQRIAQHDKKKCCEVGRNGAINVRNAGEQTNARHVLRQFSRPPLPKPKTNIYIASYIRRAITL